MNPDRNPFLESIRDDEAARLLADAYPSYLSYVDRSYRYRFVNVAYERVFGIEREQILGKHVRDVWGDTIFEPLKINLDRALSGERFTIEMPFHERYLVTAYVPHFGGEGEVLGTLIFAQDTTELQASRAAAIQSERMASLGRLVAGLLHEINTPLGVLGSNFDMVHRSLEKSIELLDSEDAGDPESFSRLKKWLAASAGLRRASQDSLSRIRAVLHGLKSFAALDEAEVRPVDLHEGLESTLVLVEHLLGPGIEVVKSYGTIPEISGRPAELNQVFMSLLRNAIEALDGKGRIGIRTLELDDSVRVEISDTGRGMTEDAMAEIFEPAFVSTSTRMKAGFGLFVSANIVRRHGGEIRVESEFGKGSRFTVVLPLRPSAN